MQRVFVHELRASLATVDLELAPREAFKVAWPVWPGVGPVDVALVEPDETRRAFLELKWGEGTLYNCIWDLAKMATAVTIPEAATAFLIAGAPDSDWAGADGEHVIADGEPKQAKALLRLLVKDLRVNSKREILPTYRVINDAVCALPSSVGGTGLEPVTPSLSIWCDRSRQFVSVRSAGIVERKHAATERFSERERTLILAILATLASTSLCPRFSLGALYRCTACN